MEIKVNKDYKVPGSVKTKYSINGIKSGIKLCTFMF